MVVAAGVCINLGIYDIASSLGVTITTTMELMAQLLVAAIALLDGVFAYSVTSNKMRIHNVHCAGEMCAGYRIKDAANCCDAIVRCFCKMYNVLMAMLVWLSMILIIILSTVMIWFSGIALFVRAMCVVDNSSLQSFICLASSISQPPLLLWWQGSIL